MRVLPSRIPAMRVLPILALLAAGLPALAQRPPAPPEEQLLRPGGREGYAVDQSNGCWAWMSGFPPGAQDFTFQWSGICPNGRAEGPGRSVLTWREAGIERQMIHEGTLRDGKTTGPGTLAHLENGEAVVLESGTFENDLLVSGRIEIPATGLVYEGAVRRGRPHGRGRMTFEGQSFEGVWNLGCLQLPGDRWIAFGRPAASCREQSS